MKDSDVEKISGWRYIELIWPLNDMFRSRLSDIADITYDPANEGAADEALIAYSERPEAGTWGSLSNDVWRVLLERHMQMIDVAMANEVAGNQLTTLPAGLSEFDQRLGLMLLWLFRMKLPWPPADRSHLQLPSVMPERPLRGH